MIGFYRFFSWSLSIGFFRPPSSEGFTKSGIELGGRKKPIDRLHEKKRLLLCVADPRGYSGNAQSSHGNHAGTSCRSTSFARCGRGGLARERPVHHSFEHRDQRIRRQRMLYVGETLLPSLRP